jgi:hypothetical protein
MIKLKTIENTLSKLKIEELEYIESIIHKIYRERKANIIYDDDYGVWTEDDQMSIFQEIIDTIDNKENGKSQKK